MKRHLGYDPLTGITETFVSTDDGFQIVSTQDATPVLEGNKERQNMGRAGYARDPDMWRVASIPNILLLQWAHEDGVPPSMVYSTEYANRVAKRLNDPDYRHLKTGNIRI